MEEKMSRELVTRGNLDGIVSAAVFLRRFPGAGIVFTTSPAAAAPLIRNGSADLTILADLALTPGLVDAVGEAREDRDVTVVDHHPSSFSFPWATVDTGSSAAGVLYRHLSGEGMDDMVSLADLYENADTPLLRSARRRLGEDRLRKEAEVLDFAWRCCVDDDAFRLQAATCLSSGLMPSVHPEILGRHEKVVGQDHWGRALEKVRRGLRRQGGVGVLELGGRRPSFHGFGSRALTEVARREGCRYAVMINRGEKMSVVSLRAAAPGCIDLGSFITEFTDRHGIEGGGHPASAGGRIPSEAAPLLLEQLEALT